jgi:hypothetical protein
MIQPQKQTVTYFIRTKNMNGIVCEIVAFLLS